jgi:hypothetical protein
VALLETALHDAAGASPVIYLAQVRNWSVHELELTRPLRLADLRNHELDRLSLTRHQLVDTTAAHYPCTRRWAARLHGTSSNDSGHDGIIWHSRQAELYGQINPGSLLADVVHHVAAEVAVLWSPPAAADPFVATGASITLVDDGAPTRFLEELAFLVGASLE